MKARITNLVVTFGLAAILTVSTFAQEKSAGLTPAEAKSIAQDGFVFGLPLVYIATQADAQSNVPKPEPPYGSTSRKSKSPMAPGNRRE